MRVVQPDHGGQHQADGQQQLEHRRATPTSFRAEHFGQIERHHHADQAAADALQQAPHQQRAIAIGQGHHRNARGEQHAGQQHRATAADQVGDHPGEQRRQHTAQQHRSDHETQLLAGQVPARGGGGLQIGQGTGDDADVDAIEQPAHAADEQQISYRPARRGGAGVHGKGCGNVVHRAGPVCKCVRHGGAGVSAQSSAMSSPSTTTPRTRRSWSSTTRSAQAPVAMRPRSSMPR
ncbi:hypothetical protein D3C71_1192100 [compost metagenome]